MRVSTKRQVTIPQHIREKLGIIPATDIEFVEEKDRHYLSLLYLSEIIITL